MFSKQNLQLACNWWSRNFNEGCLWIQSKL